MVYAGFLFFDVSSILRSDGTREDNPLLMEHIKLGEDDQLVSSDAVSLFTSIVPANDQ